MTPVTFLAAHAMMADEQPEYLLLPAHVGEGIVTTCWALTPAELEMIQRTGQVWVQTKTFNAPLQPLRLSVEYPL
jgi:hypothetical protein